MTAPLTPPGSSSERLSAWWERHQVALYFAALAAGLVIGMLAPASRHLELGISPALGLLLYVTFLGVPFTRLGRAFGDLRFISALLVVNFVLVPVLVFALSRLVSDDSGLLLGVLLVLLTPCIDYVIVFSALAGAAHEKLLAATPALMLGQLLLLPVYLSLIAGPSTLAVLDPVPFIEAFVTLIALPMVCAALTQWAMSRFRFARSTAQLGQASMVPLMMIVLFTVVASQAHLILPNLDVLAGLVPLYAVFLLAMTLVGALAGRFAGLAVASARALLFSAATRNSLVVLPLALAVPAGFELAPVAVVTQTLVELVGMVVLVRVVPHLVR